MLPFKLLLFLQAAFAPLLAAQNQIPELSISQERSFKLRTFISHVVDGAPTRFRYLFDESYSSEQKRTKIKYKTLGEGKEDWFKKASVPFAGTILIDGPSRPPLVVFNSFVDVLRCKELDWWKFEQLCQIDVIKSLSNDKQMLDADLTRVHGPSNLLFWFEKIRNELEPVKITLGVEVRGIPSLMFRHPFTGPDSVQTYSYYAKSQIGNGGKGMPLRITIDYEHGKIVQYDFHASSEIKREREDPQVSVNEYFADDLNFDEFFIPRAVGCSSAGNRSDIASLLSLTTSQESFSFTAHLPLSVDERDLLQDIVYDKKLNLMRIDQEAGERRFSSLINFMSGEMHRVIVKSNQSNVANVVATEHTTLMMQDQDEANCIKIKLPKMEANMNLMLFGSKGGNWRYLGLAQMRGMRARVFELYDSEWPFWLQQPVSYAKSWFDGRDHPDEIHEGAIGRGLKLNTVVYIQDNGQLKDMTGLNHLIGVEVFVMNDNTNKIITTIPISISDFTWRVSQIGNWPRISDVFSLADKCTASIEEVKQHVRVSISLSSDSLMIVDEVKKDFAVGHKRDLSLIESLQFDLGIPGSMIYDLRSKIQFEGQLTRIGLTFLMSKSKQPLARIRFYGTGAIKMEALSKLTTWYTSLSECYKIVAQQKVNTFFGYSKFRRLCAIESNSDFSFRVPQNEDEAKRVEPKLFDVVANGSIDIYFVYHDSEADEPDLIEKLRDLSQRSRAGEEQLMKRLLVPVPDQRILKVSFVVQTFQVSDIYAKRNGQLPQIDPKDAKRLHNFCLVPDSSLVRLHTFGDDKGTQIGQSKPTLDFASCQLACLLDNDCRSFSFCLRGAQVECALTSVDFGDANLVFQLIDVMQNQAKNNSKAKILTLKVDNDREIRVKQQANCELHQKAYLNLYTRSKRQLKANKMEDFVIRSISDGREGCARRCFDQTESVLPKLAVLTDQINSNLEEILADRDRESPKSESLLEQQTSMGRELCLGFFYLDLLNVNSLPSAIANRFQTDDQNKEANTGFCITKSTKPTEPIANSELEAGMQLVDLEEFLFKFETTYERQPGLKLIEGQKTTSEREVLRKYSDTKESAIEPNELQTLKGLIERRVNSQTVLMTGSVDLAICARACTMQLVGPWPSCKSFDLVVHPSGLNSTNTLCILNSISYADAVEAGRNDLISMDNTHLRMQTHYEPIFNTGGLARWRPALKHDDNQSKSSASFASFIVSVIGLITGLSLGVEIGKRVLSGFNRDRSLLDECQPRIRADLENSFDLDAVAVQ